MLSHDASTFSSGFTTGTTFSHTCSGSNRGLLVVCMLHPSSTTPSGVTYNSVSMTQEFVGSSATGKFVVYSLENPSSGSNSVIVSGTTQSSNFAVAVSVTDGDQSTLYGGSETSTLDSVPGSTSLSNSITTSRSNSLIVTAIKWESDIGSQAATGTNHTLQVSSASGAPEGSAGTQVTGASGSYTSGYSWTTNSRAHQMHIELLQDESVTSTTSSTSSTTSSTTTTVTSTSSTTSTATSSSSTTSTNTSSSTTSTNTSTSSTTSTNTSTSSTTSTATSTSSTTSTATSSSSTSSSTTTNSPFLFAELEILPVKPGLEIMRS